MTPHERRRARQAALQMLYSREVGQLDVETAIARYPSVEGAEQSPPVLELASALVRGTAEHLEAIDPLIAAQTEHWRLPRMAVVDRLILRMAVYELLHRPGTPPAVVINEALELARAFSGEDAVRFVNGVLDALRRSLAPDREGGPAGGEGSGPEPS